VCLLRGTFCPHIELNRKVLSLDRYLQTTRFLPRYETVTRCVMSGRFGFNPVKVKVKVQFITCREGPDGEWRYSSTLSVTSALDGGWLVNATPRPLYPRDRD
jgi:hypothetical protein